MNNNKGCASPARAFYTCRCRPDNVAQCCVENTTLHYRLSHLLRFFYLNYVSEVSYKYIGMSDPVGVKIGNERFTAACSRCPRNIKLGDFASMLRPGIRATTSFNLSRNTVASQVEKPFARVTTYMANFSPVLQVASTCCGQ